MARIHGRKNSLKGKIDKKIPLYIISSLIITVILGGSIFYTSFPLFLLSPLVWFISIKKINKINLRNKKYKKGLTGEENVLHILKKLNGKYHVFNDINLPKSYYNEKAQIDIVIVSKSGVIIVEVKNIRGIASGNIDDEYISILNGNSINKIYNPIKQVKGQGYKLSKLLKSKGVDTFVTGIVYFNRFEESTKAFKIKNSKNIVFDKEKKLLKRIKKNKDYLSKEELEKVIDILDSY